MKIRNFGRGLRGSSLMPLPSLRVVACPSASTTYVLYSVLIALLYIFEARTLDKLPFRFLHVHIICFYINTQRDYQYILSCGTHTAGNW
jgi:hypothetical protein